MRLLPSLSFLSTFLLVSSVSDVALANNHGARGFGGSLLHRHHAAPPSDALIVRDTNTHLAKRFEDCRFTYYAAGLGACGKTNSGSDFIVALNSAQFAGGSNCFKEITISYKGKSTQAQIVDEVGIT
ncbi:hypothetical protein NLI96_g13072 [Meripilus lineatus]|uniref:Uncharacterized protein n=1 Tax=Meripilus lineatus TaxID=2056292 RepID=A0AAD5UP02_9APHY|nr:hypothetical protein NLI96_g13072 [Physisporinus lineatus]